MRDVVNQLLQATRKGLLRSRPVFEPYAAVTPTILAGVQASVGTTLPPELGEFLVAVGFGDIAEELSFRSEWFKRVDSGELKGAVLFAQDISGNFYACVPDDGRIVFFSRSEPGYAVLAANFRQFMEELERREYSVIEWVRAVALRPYEWSPA